MFFRKLLTAVAVSAAFSVSALACTTIVVGEGATADGSFLVARAADSNALKAQHFVIHPATKNVHGTYSTKEHNGANDFKYPLPVNGMRYTTVPNWKTGVHGAVGFNEAGVGFSGTESIFARDDALKIDPYNEATGITEDDIPEVLLPRVKTAREGVKLLGEIVEKIGAGEGFGVVLVDPKDIWYFETGTGHQWLATRVPKDQYFASGNQGRFQKYDPKSDNYMASPTLVQFAQKNGFYDPKKDGEFNFSKAYTRNDGRDRVYNDPRVWEIQKLFNPSLQQKPDEGRKFPVFLTPEKKLTLADMKTALRNHYQGTEHDPYTEKLNGDEMWRPISVFRSYETHIMQVRPWLPKEIGEVTYLGFGMAALSCYVPYYQGLDKVPENHGIGTDKADSDSIYWKYRKLQTLVMTDFAKLAPIVQKAYGDFEAQTAKDQKAMEDKYMSIYKKDPKGAQKLLSEFNTKVIKDAEALTEQLTNEIFTIRTADIQKTIFFANNKNKD
jgi:dipeptidase